MILRSAVTELCGSMPTASFQRTFVHYLIPFCSRPEAASGIMFGNFVEPVVSDKRVKCRDPSLNHSPEIRPQAVGCGIFDRFQNFQDRRRFIVQQKPSLCLPPSAQIE